ncbi:MAG: sensor signal transduction histidine kinase [Verrucomicrobiales bacterium]|nr:sensor signal transduction histidine kinase [Verrucomicrobiales bacterium]
MPTDPNSVVDQKLTSAGFPVRGGGRSASTPKPNRFANHIWRTVGCAAALAIAFALYARSEKQIDRANELRQRSLLLAGELGQSSDDLTRMVRTYVVTCDPTYKKHYQDILDIRDGKKARPEAYSRSYWDLVLVGGQVPRPDSKEAIPLLQLMQQAGFTEEEFGRLAKAKARSDELTIREFEAMKLVESTGPGAKGNRANARRILHDANYHLAKAAIMKPIDEFNVLVDERTIAAVQAAVQKSLIYRYVFVAFGLVLMFVLWRLYAALIDTLGGSVDEVHARIAKMGSGDFSATIRVKDGRQSSVLAWLSETQAKLNDSDLKRKRTEEALRRTEELYRRAIAGAGAVPYSSDYKSNSYLFMGEGIQQLIGYSTSEVSAQLWKRIVQESIMMGDTAGMSKEEASQLMTTGKVERWRCDMRVLTRDGKSRWLSDSSVQSLDEKGTPTGSAGILQDITERKLAEIATLAFSKLGRALSSASSAKEAAQLIIDVSDTLLTWDACWVSLYDPHKDEMRLVLQIDTFNGKRCADHPIGSERPSALQRQVLDSGGKLILRENTDTFQPGAMSVGDTTRPSASLMFVPIRYRDKNVGVLSIQSYTRGAYTEQNLATLQSLADQCGGALARISVDEALRNSEEKFRQLADHISDTFWIAPPDFKGMQYVSIGYEQIWGRKRDDLYARPQDWEDSLFPDDRERVLSVFATLMKDEPQVSLEYRILRPDGTVRWVHDRGFQVRDADGKVIRLTGIGSDITQRKTAEAALEEANRQLREASRQAGMSEVATSVLHNVGNVLNSVNVSCSIISEKVRNTRISSVTKTAELLSAHAGDLSEFLTTDPAGKKLPEFLSKLAVRLSEEQKAVLEEVQSLTANIEHIKSVITMQQSYARDVGGNRETLPIQQLLEDALRLNEGALRRHRVKVIRQIVDAPTITVDKHKVLQILVNLIRNAKHALTDSGRDDKQLILRIASGPDHVALSVIDNGIGIPPENLTRIFGHRFTTKKDGHGFGLHSGAIAAREMGGSLAVKSDGVGTGATFTLSLPLGSDHK